MTNKTKINNDYEINLIDIIQTIWKGRWKIVAATVILLISVFSFNEVSNKSKTFTFTTEFMPINSLEENKFIGINNIKNINNISEFKAFNKNNYNLNKNNYNLSQILNYPIITKSKLLDLYFEILNEKRLFEDAIHKYNLLNIDEYIDEQAYNIAVTKLASSVQIFKKSKFENISEGDDIYYGIIEFVHDDLEKWKAILTYVDEYVNETIKTNLQNQYQKILSLEKQRLNFEIEDFKLKIDNIKSDYDRRTFEQIIFLEEQAVIARDIGISKNVNEFRKINNYEQLVYFDKISEDPLFFLLGYQAIEKLIDIIKNRTVTNQRVFMEGLSDLEKHKRELEQSRVVERVQLIIRSSPLRANSNFHATTIDISATKIQFKGTSQKKMLILSMLIGSIIGVFYVLISYALQFQKPLEK